MQKAKINYIVDVLLGISFLMVSITGIIKFPRIIRYIGLRHKDIPIGTISSIHDWSGLIMVMLVLVHLILHFNWIVCMTKNIFFKKKECER